MRARVLFVLFLGLAATPASAGRAPLVDAAPIWWDNDTADVPTPPAEVDPPLLAYQFHETVARPFGRHTTPDNLVKSTRALFGGDRWGEAQNVNALDEVPNSSWFTNRIELFPMSIEECARGVGDGKGPDRSVPWTVVKAKTQGVTKGFNIKDAGGHTYVLKFDPPDEPWTTTGCGAIGSRIFHAAGYNVPDDNVVTFRREDLVLGDNVKITVNDTKRAMTAADLDAILSDVAKTSSGDYLAIASKFVDGKPLGPFDYKGRRKDDPNDRIQHEYRRELRGLRIIAAWVNHFDTKRHNSLDSFVEVDGRHFVKHHLIDFTAILGTGGQGSAPIEGREYAFDLTTSMARMFTFGLHEDTWRKLHRPEGIPEVGYFEVKHFEPMAFEPLLPNPAFARCTDRDGYWAAKVVTGFTREQLTAMCETGRYENPKAVPYLVDVLMGRREIIARQFFTSVCPIDFFRVEGGQLVAKDLGVERGIWRADSTLYRVRSYAVNAERDVSGKKPAWSHVDVLTLPMPEGPPSHPFDAFEFQVSRDRGEWSPSVIAYVARASMRVVAVDR